MSEINPSSVLENSGQIKESGFFGKLMDIKVGVISLPVYLVLSLIVLMAAKTGNLPNDLIGGFAVVMVLGLILSELGMKLPLLKNIGGPAILALMVPSFLVYWQVLPSGVLDSVTTLMKKANFLYLYISILVCGSMLGMHRQTLINGLARIFIPMIVGTAVAIGTGLLVGVALGYSVHHTIFYIIVPIICGGVGEGILPLSIAYSGILGNEAGTYVAQMIPAAVIGNIVAIIAAGVLKRIADRKPEYNGDGVLVKSSENLANMPSAADKPIDFSIMGAGLLMACSFFIVGTVLAHFIGIPGPIVMILAAATAKSLKIIPERLETGAFQLYKFIAGNLTWPLMVGLGMLYVPLKDVAAIISLPYVLTCVAIVVSMIISGFYIGMKINMYPVEAAIVTGCRGGLGGTGDVAILSAANRMSLMPFAQISTRIGGAATVIAATILLQMWH